jgi:hypothetical protein
MPPLLELELPFDTHEDRATVTGQKLALIDTTGVIDDAMSGTVDFIC